MRISFIIVAALSILLVQGCKKEETGVTPSGYEYIVHTKGGGEVPKPGDYVYFHAQLRNGDSVYYASREMGQEPFMQITAQDPNDPMNAMRTPSPVEEILRIIGVGDSVTVLIRLDTIPNKPPGFENTNIMYYDVVSLEIKSEAQFQMDANKQREAERGKREAAQQREPEVAATVNDLVTRYNSGQLNSQLQTTASGLKYVILEEGGGKKLEANKLVNVHYYGALTDGTMFDNSFSRGTPFTFTLGRGQVIAGWEEGIALLRQGARAIFFIPSALGYGEAGSPPVIPGNAELIFYVEVPQEM